MQCAARVVFQKVCLLISQVQELETDVSASKLSKYELHLLIVIALMAD